MMDLKKLALFALVLFAASGTLFAASYDQDCTTSGCVLPLVCRTFTEAGSMISRCTQPDTAPNVVCTVMPEAWVNPLSGLTSGNNTSGPVKYIDMLANGTGRIMNNTTGFYQAGWFSDWKLSSITGVAIAIIIIAVAAMIGHAFNLPEVKAFVDTELMQAVVSVLLVASLIGLVAFFDEVARLAIEAGNLPVVCNPNEPCYISTAKQYLDGIYDSGKEYAKTSLQNSFDRQNLASAGYSTQFNVWWLAFGGANMRPNAGESIQAERTSAIFDTVTKLLAGIYAQKYFIELISFGIAPIFLLFGALLRTFFFTRKLGGLMLAIAISLFVVYPLTFAFAWYTLNVTVYGDRVLSVSDPSCPSECTATYPVAFYINGTGDIRQFRTTQEILRAGINRSNWASGGPDLNGDSTGDYHGLVACRDLSQAGIGIGPGDPSWGNCENCPDYCRDVPFPSTLPGCDIAKCSYCNAGCKIMRQRFDCPQQCPNCPADCKLRQPVENKCYYPEGTSTPVPADLGASCGGCEGCPSWCKVLYDDGTSRVLVNKDEKPCQVDACQPVSQGGLCPDSCMYVSTLSSSETNCDQICTKDGEVCPSYCRLMDPAAVADYNTTGITGCDIPACSSACRNLCGINITGRDTEAINPGYLGNCAPFPKISTTYPYCTGCPDYCRFQQFLNYSQYDSNTKLVAGDISGVVLPEVCSKIALRDFDCEPGSCGDGCKSPSYPMLCREYASGETVDGFCTKCPKEARLTLAHTSKAGTADYSGPPALSAALKCDEGNCAGICKSNILQVTPETSNPLCKDYNAASQNCSTGTVAGQSPDACRACIAGGGATCTCDPGSAVAGGRQMATQEKAETECGYDMPTASNPVVVSDVHDCVGYSTTTPMPPTSLTAYQRLFSCADSKDCYMLDTYVDRNYGATVTQTIYSGSVPIADLTMNGMTRSSSGSTYYSGTLYVAFRPESVASASGVFVDEVRADDGYALYDSASSSWAYNNWNSGCMVNPGITYPSVHFVQTDSMHYALNWINVDRCPSGADIVLRHMTLYYTPATATTYEYADLTYSAQAPVCDPDYRSCQRCPVSCRVGFSNPAWLDATACTAQACGEENCTSDCKPAAPTSAQICYEYLGAGKDVDITAKPIGSRDNPLYNERDSCRQCPENCRIKYSDGTYYEGSCGLNVSNAGNAYIDCSAASCPDACRQTVQKPEGAGVCRALAISDKPCSSCSAFCRRSEIVIAPLTLKGEDKPPEVPEKEWNESGYCPTAYCGEINPDTHLGCTEECRFADPPSIACEGCVECPTDCLYTPPTRTDCGDVCSEEALAGPINIGPSDFIKKLPGAQGEVDVKNAGVLMIPALVLPLFCLVMVVSFIRVLSPILGGDIEIPGLGRII